METVKPEAAGWAEVGLESYREQASWLLGDGVERNTEIGLPEARDNAVIGVRDREISTLTVHRGKHCFTVPLFESSSYQHRVYPVTRLGMRSGDGGVQYTVNKFPTGVRSLHDNLEQ